MPCGLGTAEGEVGKIFKCEIGEINGVPHAAHAFINDSRNGRLAVSVDGDGHSAEGISIGLCAHHSNREGDDAGRVAVAVVSAGPQTSLVVRDVAAAGTSGAANARVARGGS